MQYILSYLLIGFLWIGGNFEKRYVNKDEVDVVEGTFYKPFPGAMSFVVDSPVKQIITYNKDTMIVYYPDSKMAFKIRSVEDLIQRSGFGGNLKESMKALQKSGYIFLKKAIKQDTVYSYWTHDKLKTTVMLVYDKKQRVYEVSVRNEKGDEMYSIKAGNYQQINDTLYFPLRLTTATKQDTETFVFSHVKKLLPDSLPGLILKPTLPDSVNVVLKNFESK